MTPDPVSQPNLDASSAQRTWSARFWIITALTGATAGIIGGALMWLLHVVETRAWRYDTGTLLEGIARASAARHIYMLLAAGVFVGVGGWLIRKTIGKPGDADSAIWFRSGRLPLLATLAQAVHSIVAVGMGTSLGRESPIKQAGGAIASQIAQWSGLSRAEQRVLVACGVGAGMAAAYNVPVGGALFAVEVLLGAITLRLALPALLCSGIATAASWLLLPTGPIYAVPEFPLSAQLTLWALLAGPLLGLATIPLVRAIGWANAHKPRRGPFRLITPIVVLTALGALSIAFPQLLGNGKDAVQLAFLDKFSIGLLLVLPVLKLLATVGCLRAGASGGLFTPTMAIGATLGALLGHGWDRIWPGASMGGCAVIGSCACLAAASQGPVSSLVLVLELTRHVDATMVPMLLAVTGAMLVARRIESQSIYSVRLHRAAPDPDAAASRLSPAIERRISTNFATVSSATGYATLARKLLQQPPGDTLYVVDHEQKLLGIIDAQSLKDARLGSMPIDNAKASDIADELAPLHATMSESQIVERLRESGAGELAVVDPATGRMVGVITNPPRHESSPKPA